MAGKTVFSGVFASYSSDWKNYKGVEYICLTFFTDLGLGFAGERERGHQEFGKDGYKNFFTG